MLEHKVIRLIQALLKKELSAIEKYLSSPHVCSNDECTRLFVLICKFLPDIDSPKLTKERLFAKLFGKQPYNDGKMRKLMTQLTQAIEQYLMEDELKQSEELKTKLLTRALSERNSYKLFSEAVLSRLKVLDKGVDRGRNYFRESYELSDLLSFHPGSAKLVKKREYQQRAIDDLERYFTLVMLQNEANNVVVNRVTSAAGSNSGYMGAAMQLAGTPSFATFNAIKLFRHLVGLLQSKSEEDLDELRRTAFDTFPQLSLFEQDFATNLLRNYAVPFTNRGSMEHARFTFDLYKLELERGLYANSMSAGAFLNIVTVGLLADEIDWVKYFIEEYKLYLPQHDRENTLNYSKGLWHYRKGSESNDVEEFYNAIQSLNLIPTRAGVNYEIRVRPALLRIHFEIYLKGKEMLEDLLNQARNFERHLNGNDDYAKSTRDAYMLFIRYYKSLVRQVSSPEDKKSLAIKFLERLNREGNDVAFKPWLIDKAKELATAG